MCFKLFCPFQPGDKIFPFSKFCDEFTQQQNKDSYLVLRHTCRSAFFAELGSVAQGGIFSLPLGASEADSPCQSHG